MTFNLMSLFCSLSSHRAGTVLKKYQGRSMESIVRDKLWKTNSFVGVPKGESHRFVSFIHSFIHAPTHSFFHSFICSLLCSFFHLFNWSLIHFSIHQMNEQMSEQMNEQMSKWMNDWISKWANVQMNECANKQTNEQMNEWTNNQMNEQSNEWMNKWMRKQMNQWMSKWACEWNEFFTIFCSCLHEKQAFHWPVFPGGSQCTCWERRWIFFMWLNWALTCHEHDSPDLQAMVGVHTLFCFLQQWH